MASARGSEKARRVPYQADRSDLRRRRDVPSTSLHPFSPEGVDRAAKKRGSSCKINPWTGANRPAQSNGDKKGEGIPLATTTTATALDTASSSEVPTLQGDEEGDPFFWLASAVEEMIPPPPCSVPPTEAAVEKELHLVINAMDNQHERTVKEMEGPKPLQGEGLQRLLLSIRDLRRRTAERDRTLTRRNIEVAESELIELEKLRLVVRQEEKIRRDYVQRKRRELDEK
jgi:hypothetical protein